MASPTVRRRRRRRLLAVGTAGMALCVGISVTSLAAWQQQINVAGSGVNSSLLSIELSLDGGSSWNTAGVNGNGSLSFGTSGNPSLLTPGDTVYASILLRAATGSRGADVKLSGGSIGTDVLLGALTYAARSGVAHADCTSSAFPTAGSLLVGTGSALSAGSGSTVFRIPAATASLPGTPVGVCLGVSLPSGVANAVGGLSAAPIWRFDATSV